MDSLPSETDTRGTARVVHGNALDLPLPDASVDLIVTSPPYFGLRSYRDGGEHMGGQIGAEATPAEFVDALIAATREMIRVLKPTGSIWVNLGDKYSRGSWPRGQPDQFRPGAEITYDDERYVNDNTPEGSGVPGKSLIGVPWRYAIRCIDDLGLILRAEVIWAKPNGMPESVTDRVRRSHEQWFHFTLNPHYYAAVDEIREAHESPRHAPGNTATVTAAQIRGRDDAGKGISGHYAEPGRVWGNPLGKLPGSVWHIATQPFKAPASLGVDHYACVDTETEILTRRGWLRHDEVTTDDEVMGHDLDTGLARWTRVHDVHRYDYDGELVTADARGLSMRLTPNHRTLTHAHAGRHRLRQPIRVVRADEVTKFHSIPRSVDWSGDDGREKSLGFDMAALLGWTAAEGWYTPNRAVYLSQSLTKNPTHVATIDALLDRLGGAYRVERPRVWRGVGWTDVTWRLNPALSAEVRRIMPDKKLTTMDPPLIEARAMLDAFIAGDGHDRPDGRRAIFQKYRHNLDVLQALAVRCGYNTTLSENGGRWVLYLNPPRPARLRRSDGTPLVGREHYQGTVWCVTTGTGTFIARRRGTVFVTGNSFPMEFPRRIITGWSPRHVCTACGEGRRPITSKSAAGAEMSHADMGGRWDPARIEQFGENESRGVYARSTWARDVGYSITGYACACPDTTAATTPGVVLDPFGGTGTTALVAKMLGREGISVDLSEDYCRLARWRVDDPKQLERALVAKPDKPVVFVEDEPALVDGVTPDNVIPFVGSGVRSSLLALPAFPRVVEPEPSPFTLLAL